MPKQLTQEEFEQKANSIHSNKYLYKKAVYTGNRNKVSIVCPVHGEFLQKAKSHLEGRGCHKCADEANGYTTEVFIAKATARHKGRYTYENSVYTIGDDKISITCKEHGNFDQVATDHLRGAGCPMCRIENSGWTDSKWEKQGNNSKHFEGFKLYILRCYNDTESFIKVGKTFRSIALRYKNKEKLPYEYEVLKVVEGSASHISKLEREIQNSNLEYKYEPSIFFKGFSECFTEVHMPIGLKQTVAIAYHRELGEISRNIIPIKLVESK